MRNTLEQTPQQLINTALNILDEAVFFRTTADDANARAAIANAYLRAADLKSRGL